MHACDRCCLPQAYYGASAYPSMHGGAPAGAGGAAAGGKDAGKAAPVQIYDPLAAASVDKMNNVYIHRHMPVFTGSAMRVKLVG